MERWNFQEHGVELITGLEPDRCPEVRAEVWRALEEHGKATDRWAGGTGRPAEGERRRFKYRRLDGYQCLAHAPVLWTLYSRLRPAVAEVTGREVIFSPWTQGAVTAKLYLEEGAEHGWHTDTNSVTLLLSLLEGGSPLEFSPGGRHHSEVETQRAVPNLGQGLVLRKDVWHRVPPKPADGPPRLSIVLNYYHPDDVQAPRGLSYIG